MESAPVSILLISGSLRGGSVNGAVLRTAQTLAPYGLTLEIYTRMGELPHFNPDDDREPLSVAVADLRASLTACDAVLFSTPEYAGALPGSFKNLLDWTVGGGIQERSVGWINASMGGAKGTYEQLRTVLAYVSTDIVAEACAEIPVPRGAIGVDGVIADEGIRAAIAGVVRVLGDRVAARRSTTSKPR
jgi:chromate reductase, NAD(P)H dehydrogenase (quinone)